MLIHGFSKVNARLLMAFGTAFYAIIVVVFELELLKSGWGNSSVDEGQFVKYFLSFGVCQRPAVCNNMDRRCLN